MVLKRGTKELSEIFPEQNKPKEKSKIEEKEAIVQEQEQ